MGQWKVDCIDGRRRHKRQMVRRANRVYYYRTKDYDGKQVMVYTASPKRKKSLAIPMGMIEPGKTANDYKICWLDMLVI